jgi:hypothetical protein
MLLSKRMTLMSWQIILCLNECTCICFSFLIFLIFTRTDSVILILLIWQRLASSQILLFEIRKSPYSHTRTNEIHIHVCHMLNYNWNVLFRRFGFSACVLPWWRQRRGHTFWWRRNLDVQFIRRYLSKIILELVCLNNIQNKIGQTLQTKLSQYYAARITIIQLKMQRDCCRRQLTIDSTLQKHFKSLLKF